MTTCRDCGNQFRFGPLVDLPQPTRCMECLIALAAKLAEAEARAERYEKAYRITVGYAENCDPSNGVVHFGVDEGCAQWHRDMAELRALLAPPADGGGGE